jgi:hypothetical protein
VRGVVVNVLARVLFQVGAADTDLFNAAVRQRDFQEALGAQRQVILADLVVLGQVGIVVTLAVPLVKPATLQPSASPPGWNTRRPFCSSPAARGHADAHRADVRVGRVAEWLAQRQNILVSVASSTCISNPIRGSTFSLSVVSLMEVSGLVVTTFPYIFQSGSDRDDFQL